MIDKNDIKKSIKRVGAAVTAAAMLSTAAGCKREEEVFLPDTNSYITYQTYPDWETEVNDYIKKIDSGLAKFVDSKYFDNAQFIYSNIKNYYFDALSYINEIENPSYPYSDEVIEGYKERVTNDLEKAMQELESYFGNDLYVEVDRAYTEEISLTDILNKEQYVTFTLQNLDETNKESYKEIMSVTKNKFNRYEKLKSIILKQDVNNIDNSILENMNYILDLIIDDITSLNKDTILSSTSAEKRNMSK